MDPLTAIALAGNILQFAETATNIISSTRQFSRQGAKNSDIELESIAQELQKLVKRVIPAEPEEGNQLSDEEKSIRNLGKQCDQVAQELLDALGSLKVKSKDGSYGGFESFYKGLLSVWKEPKVRALEQRLSRIGSSIQTYIANYDSQKILHQVEDLKFQGQRHHEFALRDARYTELGNEVRKAFSNITTKLREEESRNRTVQLLLHAAANGSRYAAEQAILEELWFPEINQRQDDVPLAHDHSLGWIFDTGEQNSPATFNEWLLSKDDRDDLYWISGKPGSGKSTLMKFFCSNPTTINTLKAKAYQKRVVTANYFFWESGVILQKSQEGVLRSLIYQILGQCPELIPQVYPKTWRAYFPHGNECSTAQPGARNASVTTPLSIRALLDTWKAIATIDQMSQTLCFFCVDGLDEYQKSPGDISLFELTKRLRELPNLKLCVSSRPLNAFEDNFGKDASRKLYMEDWNREDIRAYVRDIFSRDENYQELDDKDLNGVPLVEEIVEKANGVFLWVFLVVRSLQEGLLNRDTAADLRKRLEGFPAELNDFFSHILLAVDEFYHGHSAEMLSTTLKGEENIPLIAYSYIRDDAEEVLKMEVGTLSRQQVNNRMKDAAKRLNASCKLLLEIRNHKTNMGDRDDNSLPWSVFFERKVGFLHRTVREFLQLSTTQNILKDRSSGQFEPHQTICKMILAQIKISPKEPEYGPQISQLEKIFEEHDVMVPSTADHSLSDKYRQDLQEAHAHPEAAQAEITYRPKQSTSEVAKVVNHEKPGSKLERSIKRFRLEVRGLFGRDKIE